MKKRLMCLLLAAVLLMGLLGGCSKTISVETDLEDMELEGEEEWKTGEDYKAELVPDDDYMLPEKITIKVDGSKLSAKNYEYDPEDGDLTIPGEFVTGDIEIIGEAEKVTLVGVWSGSIDVSDMAEWWLGEAISDEAMEYFSFSGLSIQMTMEFIENGTYSLYVEEDSIEELEENLTAQFEEGMIKVLEFTLVEIGEEMALEEYLESEGYSLEGLIEQYKGMFHINDFIDEFSYLEETGDYEQDSSVIYFGYSDGIPYSLEGRQLTIDATGHGDVFEEMLFPMVLKRVS